MRHNLVSVGEYRVVVSSHNGLVCVEIPDTRTASDKKHGMNLKYFNGTHIHVLSVCVCV